MTVRVVTVTDGRIGMTVPIAMTDRNVMDTATARSGRGPIREEGFWARLKKSHTGGDRPDRQDRHDHHDRQGYRDRGGREIGMDIGIAGAPYRHDRHDTMIVMTTMIVHDRHNHHDRHEHHDRMIGTTAMGVTALSERPIRVASRRWLLGQDPTVASGQLEPLNRRPVGVGSSP
jgi:hypothetical protein